MGRLGLEGEPTRYDSIVSSKRIKLHSTVSGVWDCLVELEDKVEAGSLLGVVKNTFGEVIESVHATDTGIISMKRCFYSVKAEELLIVISSLEK